MTGKRVPIAVYVLLMVVAAPVLLRAADTKPGILATFRQGEAADHLVLPNFSFYVPFGTAPTDFLAPGKWTAELQAWLKADLPRQYTFSAEFSGNILFEVNGTVLIQGSGRGERIISERQIRLARGTNSMRVEFTPAPQGDAYLRVYWQQKGKTEIWIPDELLSHAPTRLTEFSEQLRAGRKLYSELNCGGCHQSRDASERLEAPSFEAIGDRLRQDWMEEWIYAPSGRGMPKLFHEANGKEKARQAAAYLSSLRTAQKLKERTIEAAPSPEQRIRGKQLYDQLLCGSCHKGEQELSPEQLDAKFAHQALKAYLQKPEKYFPSSRMPNFGLTAEEAAALAAYLSRTNSSQSEKLSPDLIKTGKEVVETAGCLNCHSPTSQNQSLFAKQLHAITPEGLSRGCLAEAQTEGVPHYRLGQEERDHLRVFLKQTVQRPVLNSAAEFTLRQLAPLNCAACHEQREELPSLQMIGRKLNPVWTHRFIAGNVEYKPRPWLAARMPAYPAYAEKLALGLAHLRGYGIPQRTEITEGASLVPIGKQLIFAEGGFACNACHQVGAHPAGQVVESPGVNLAYASERLLESFFHRWVLNPMSIDPGTRMPVYFDAEGRSPLPEILDGEAAKQIEAMWQYLRTEAPEQQEKK